MPRLILCLLMSFVALGSRAQDGELPEYQQEIGGGLGISSYIGDAAGGFMKHPGFYGTAIWRRNINARMVIKANIGAGHISGDTEGMYLPTDPNSKTPEGGQPTVPIHFSRNFAEAGIQFELNFLGYGMGAAYKGLKRWTPYMLVGAGVVIGMGGGADVCAGLCIPLGVGFKFKVKPRLNIGVEWTFNFTTTDRLDDANYDTHLVDPYGIKSGLFKNKDCYTRLAATITYDFAPKYRKCNN